mmetsp:Transcript_55373/g.101509  ORF Transcript_55373/g.101509 Transcript_55373/m.101509 type:complete len:276 (-) Transcript_55373:494-1321(-)
MAAVAAAVEVPARQVALVPLALVGAQLCSASNGLPFGIPAHAAPPVGPPALRSHNRDWSRSHPTSLHSTSFCPPGPAASQHQSWADDSWEQQENSTTMPAEQVAVRSPAPKSLRRRCLLQDYATTANPEEGALPQLLKEVLPPSGHWSPSGPGSPNPHPNCPRRLATGPAGRKDSLEAATPGEGAQVLAAPPQLLAMLADQQSLVAPEVLQQSSVAPEEAPQYARQQPSSVALEDALEVAAPLVAQAAPPLALPLQQMLPPPWARPSPRSTSCLG